VQVLILAASSANPARIAESVNRRGFPAIACETPAEAAETLDGSTAAAVVLAGLCPGEIARHARVLRAAAHGHVAILASAPTPALAQEALRAGADDVYDPRVSGSLAARLAVIEHNAHRHSFVANAADAIFTVSPEGLFTEANAEAVRLTGYARKDILGMHYSRLAAAEYIEPLQAQLEEKLLQSSSPAAEPGFIVLDIVRADGERIPVEISTRPLFRRGRAAGLQGIARDLRPRRQLEREIAFRADFLDRVDASAHAVDPSGRVVYWNAAAERLFGYPRHEATGRLIRDLILPPAERPASDGHVAHLLAGNGLSGEFQLRKKDGATFPAEVAATPLTGPDGQVAAVVAITFDLTQRRAQEERLAHYAAIIESSNDAVIEHDIDGIIVGWNAAAHEIFGYTSAEVLGRHMDFLAREKDRERVEAVRLRAVGGIPWAGRVRRVHRDGSIISLNISFFPVRGPGGAVQGTATVARDVTEQSRLLEARARLAAIVESTSDAIVERDLAGRIITWNAAAERIYGATAKDALSRPPEELFAPADVEAGGRIRERVIRGEAIDDERLERIGPDGQPQVLAFAAFPVRGTSGDVIGTATVARDVTAQARAEEERLRSLETAARLARIIESANEAIVSSDAEGRIVYANPAVERLFGYSSEEMSGHRWTDTVPPNLLERDLASIRQSIAGQLPSGFVTHRLRKDGSVAAVHVSTVALTDDAGTFTGSASFVSDITEQVRQERQAAERVADIKAVFANASEGIVLIDPDQRVRSFNEAARQLIRRLQGGDLQAGDQALKWVLPADHEAFEKDWRAALAGRTSRIARPVTGAAGDFWWEFSFSPIVLSDGSTSGVALRMRDITEEKHTADALVQAQKTESLAVLAGGIAHDFNNLLVGILLNAGLVLAELPPGSPACKTIQAIETSGQRAADLARQMLAYSGKGSFVIRNINLNPVVTEMTELLQSSIGKGVHLDLNLDFALPRIEADVTQLRQVIMNLVINASDAIGAGDGSISITTRPVEMTKAALRQVYLAPGLAPGAYVSLEVTDTGSGMDRETLARIFDPFFTTKFTGRGLGLAAVLGIMRGHHGAIKVESTPGQGSTFRLLFPVAPSREDQLPASSREQSPANGTILVVDDEPTVRAVTSRALRSFGFEVIEASDGAAGAEAFATNSRRIDCVLLDLTMPRMGGEDAFLAMRAADPDVPILLMSGFTEDDSRRRFGSLGIAGFIEKPFALATLHDAIHAAIATRRPAPAPR